MIFDNLANQQGTKQEQRVVSLIEPGQPRPDRCRCPERGRRRFPEMVWGPKTAASEHPICFKCNILGFDRSVSRAPPARCLCGASRTGVSLRESGGRVVDPHRSPGGQPGIAAAPESLGRRRRPDPGTGCPARGGQSLAARLSGGLEADERRP